MSLLTQAEVEAELQRLSGLLEERTEEYAIAVREHAEADVALKMLDARLKIQEANRDIDKKRTAAEKNAAVLLRSETEYHKAAITAAAAEGCKQALYSLRAQINALQTISSNIRSQT